MKWPWTKNEPTPSPQKTLVLTTPLADADRDDETLLIISDNDRYTTKFNVDVDCLRRLISQGLVVVTVKTTPQGRARAAMLTGAT